MLNARAPKGARVYAVGDVHGCARLLGQLHQMIAEDAARASSERNVVVYLGDYIDRGPETSAVIDLVQTGPEGKFERVHLKGNHEDILMRYLNADPKADFWDAIGGGATFRSYGVDPDDLAARRKSLATQIPRGHRQFFKALKLTHIEGDYLFVHAGLKPGVALAAQAEQDLLWIRHPFLDSSEDWGYTVVHGHSPVETPEIRENRINLDTGAVWSGRLTAMVFHDDHRDVLQT